MLLREPLFLIKRYDEFVPKDKKKSVPRATRGVYALLKKGWAGHGKNKREKYDVIYVGMSASDIHHRLNAHAKSRRKGKLWDHFSIFEVNDNIYDELIRELEGLLRHIYRKDRNANRINKARGYKKLGRHKLEPEKWTNQGVTD